MDLVITDVVVVNPEGKQKFKYIRKIQSNSIQMISNVIDDFLNPHIQMHAVTYKTANLRELNYYQTEGISYTDQEWMFIPMTKVETVYYYPVVLYQYLVGRDGQTVESDAHIRNISHHIKSDFYMLSLLEKVPKSHIIYRYLKNRCSSCFIALYYRYLILRPKTLQISDLVRIDNKLSSNDVIYKETMRATKMQIHYIKLWRESGKADKMPIQIIILSVIINLLNAIRKNMRCMIPNIFA